MDPSSKEIRAALVKRPEDLIYRTCYAPVDLASMLADSEGRGRIRRLPPAQLFFSLKELDDEQIARLLPQVTEEQWAAVLDFEAWERDRLCLPALLGWQRHLLDADEPVARKLLRAVEPEVLELAFSKGLLIFARTDNGEFEGDPGDADAFISPDGQFLIAFRRGGEQARILHALLARLFEIDPESAALLIQESRFRTRTELEEAAFQNRCRRLEDLGFPDYYDALSVYAPLARDLPLTEKPVPGGSSGGGALPVPSGIFQGYRPMLLLQALATVSVDGRIESLVEELFLLCNKVMAADRIGPGDSDRIRRGLRKVLCGVNLGLSLWSDDDLDRAVRGIRSHYLAQFFQVGYGALLRLKEQARRQAAAAGGRLPVRLTGLLKRYPVLLRRRRGRLQYRHLADRMDVELATLGLNRLAEARR